MTVSEPTQSAGFVHAVADRLREEWRYIDIDYYTPDDWVAVVESVLAHVEAQRQIDGEVAP
jgi:hypothetical protein